MSLAALVDALGDAGLDPDPVAILDALWLAAHAPPLGPPTAGTKPSPPPPSLPSSPEPRPDRPSPVDRPAPDMAADAPPESGTHDPAPARADPGIVDAFAEAVIGDGARRASAVSIGAAPPLADRLGLMRAVRPFQQRWRSTRVQELDEEATAELAAELRAACPDALVPVLRPRRERWFEVELVLEDDEAVLLWSDTLGAFAQALRDTGAFRAVRRWRLSLDPAAPVHGRATLTAPSGARLPAGALNGAERRLILFATHGGARHWTDGAYARLLAGWARDAAVAVLPLLPARRWRRTPLGDADGACSTDRAGAAAALLDVQPFWWSEAADEPDSLAVPMVALNPAALAEWAAMLMNRGRPAPALLLPRTGPADMAEAPPRRAVPAELGEEEAARRVAALHEASPEAFELATLLCPTSFTVPVARLIQEARFGRVDQDVLSELFVSGLLAARPSAARGGLAATYVVQPRAAALLRRSLSGREADAAADALVERVSAHIRARTGTLVSQTVFTPDAAGRFALPEAVLPFATVAAELRASVAARRRAAAAVAPVAAPPDAGPLAGARLLWVDDRPENNAVPRARFEAEGASVVAVETTDAALEEIGAGFDLVISDMARREGDREGLMLLGALRERGIRTPVVIFAAWYADRAENRAEALAAGAAGITNDADELHAMVGTLVRGARSSAAEVPAEAGDNHALILTEDSGSERIHARSGEAFAILAEDSMGVPAGNIVRYTVDQLLAAPPALDALFPPLAREDARRAGTAFVYVASATAERLGEVGLWGDNGGTVLSISAAMTQLCTSGRFERVMLIVDDVVWTMLNVLRPTSGSSTRPATGPPSPLLRIVGGGRRQSTDGEADEVLWMTRALIETIEALGDAADVPSRAIEAGVSERLTARMKTSASFDFVSPQFERTGDFLLPRIVRAARRALRPWDSYAGEAIRDAEKRTPDADLRALRGYERALALRPDQADPGRLAQLTVYRAAMLKRLDRLAEAETALVETKSLWAGTPIEADAWYNLASIFALREQRAAMLEALAETRGAERARAAVRAHLGDYFARYADDPALIAFLDHDAEELDPDEPAGAQLLEVIQDHDRALKESPDAPDPELRARLTVRRAAMLKRLGRLAEAETALDGTRSLWTGTAVEADAWYTLASIHAMKGGRGAMLEALAETRGADRVREAVRKHLGDYFARYADDPALIAYLDGAPPAPDGRSAPVADGFCTAAEILAIAGAELGADERPRAQLLIYSTERQRTWLVATARSLLFLLDDADTRRQRRLVQRTMAAGEALPVAAAVDREGVGSVGFGRGKQRTYWFYSRELFKSPRDAEVAIRSLLDAGLTGGGAA